MSTAARPFAGEIRLARPHDYPRMAELAEQLGYPSSSDDIARRLEGFIRTSAQVMFVVGWNIGLDWRVVYRCVETGPTGSRVVILGDRRGRRQFHGSRAEAWARGKGFSATSLRSNVIRERAHAFYERQGYEHTKTQKSFRKKL